MKIIKPIDFYEVLLKTDTNSKCSIRLLNPMKICPICNLYFYSSTDDFCPFCINQKMITQNDFLINFHELLGNSFVGIDLSNGKEILFDILNVTHFDNQEEQYFIVKI